MLDVLLDVVKVVAGLGVAGSLVKLFAGVLKQTKFVQRAQLDVLVDSLASRAVDYVEDLARETGGKGPEKREQAVNLLTQQVADITREEAEERIRAAYQRMVRE